MKALKHILPFAFIVSLLLALAIWILYTSLGFQECVKTYSGGFPGGEYFNEGRSQIVANLPVWRHCAGAYALENNAVVNAIGTVVIAIFTMILAMFTVSLAGSTRTAADAAKIAAEHIPVVEGAHVYAVIKKDEVFALIQAMGHGDGNALADEIPLYVALSNFGKTPAFVESFTARISYISAGKRVDGFAERIQPNTIIAAGHETDPPLRIASPGLLPADAEALWRAAAHLILIGRLVYRDIWGGMWSVDFDGRTDNDRNCFRIDNRPRKKT